MMNIFQMLFNFYKNNVDDMQQVRFLVIKCKILKITVFSIPFHSKCEDSLYLRFLTYSLSKKTFQKNFFMEEYIYIT